MAGLTAKSPGRPRIAVPALTALRPTAAFRSWAAAYFVCLVPALLVTAGQPIWSRVDEAQHWDFIAQLAHGAYPVEGQTMIRQETADLMAETAIFRWNVPGEQPIPLTRDGTRFTTVPPYLHGYARKLWIGRHI